MKTEARLVVVLLASISGLFCNGAVYKVGDNSGWAVTPNMDFNKWASIKTFHVGDTLIFEYDRQNHNVLRVSREAFHTCETHAPLAAYDNGNDSIVIRLPGHYYYMCGFVGHCQAGQKVDIRVPKVDGPGPTSLPIQSRNETSASALAPGPSISGGHYSYGLSPFRIGLFCSFIWAFYGFL